jgi:hypothetical protein
MPVTSGQGFAWAYIKNIKNIKLYKRCPAELPFKPAREWGPPAGWGKRAGRGGRLVELWRLGCCGPL